MRKKMKVLILAGGYDQIALIQEFKSRKYETILIDYYDEPPAKRYADKHYKVSTLDVDKVKDIAKNEQVNIISTACTDQALVTMAKVSEELGLSCYLSYQTALEFTNKAYMKNKMIEAKIPTAKFQIISKEDDVNIEKLSLPVVVKPVDANSSKGVQKVFDIQWLKQAIKNAREYSREQKVIVEEYKEGDELSIDAWVQEGKVIILCISKSVKVKENGGKFTIVQSQYPYALSLDEKVKIEDILQKIADEFELKNSPLLVQLIKGRDGISVIEFSARMGGGTKYRLINRVTGMDIMKCFVDLSLGKEIDLKFEQTEDNIHMNYDYCNNGKIVSFMGFEDLLKENIIEEYFLYKTPGMIIDKMENSGDRASGYLISAESKEKLSEKEKKAEESIKIMSDKGMDIKRRILHG